MKIVITDGDLQKMDSQLREGLKAFVFGSGYRTVPTIGDDAGVIRPGSLVGPVDLDEIAARLLWEGVNEASRQILIEFAAHHGEVSAQQLMEVIGATSPRQLAGPMGGIIRKLRSMFGTDVVLWSHDRVRQIYRMSRGTADRFAFLAGLSEEGRLAQWEKQHEDELRQMAPVDRTGDEKEEEERKARERRDAMSDEQRKEQDRKTREHLERIKADEEAAAIKRYGTKELWRAELAKQEAERRDQEQRLSAYAEGRGKELLPKLRLKAGEE